VTIAVSANGPRFEAQLDQDEHGNLCVYQLGRTRDERVVSWALGIVLAFGWRIVGATPGEQALLDAHGFGIGRVQ
jgi:hypothetical protein